MMEPLDPRRDALTVWIEATFPDPGYPTDLRPCPHRCEECDDLSETFRGRRWHDIAEMPMLPLNAATSLLGDDAFAYFLPALMIGCLRDPEEADVTLDFLAWGFLKPKFTRQRILAALAPEARAAVFNWLAWWIDHGDFEDWNPGNEYDSRVHEEAEKYRARLRDLQDTFGSS